MNATPLNELLQNLIIKLDRVIPLVGSVEHPSADLEELIEDGWDDDILVEAGFTQSQLEYIRDTEDWEYCSGIISKWPSHGILVHASTPFPIGKVRMEGGHPMGAYSWGAYHTKWFHVSTLEDLVDVLPQWRDEVWMKYTEVEGGEG